MDAMQNESASSEQAQPAEAPAEQAQPAEAAVQTVEENPAEPEAAAPAEAPEKPEQPEQAADDVPRPRGESEAAPAVPESNGGKAAKKRKAAPKSKTAGTKSLVVFREGRVHYADEMVVVLDLDDAAHPDTDVHDVVDKLSELRDAVESPGRAEAVSLIGELIQAKALA